MKEKNSATASVLKRILVNCSAQAKQYGSCVAARVPEVERDMCLKEFLVLKNCMRNVLQGKEHVGMSGKASASNHPGFSVSDALSHVYIQYPPLRCTLTGTKSFLYDDGNKLLLGLTSDRVFSWKTAPYNPHVAPSSDPLCEGPVLSIRYSLDLKLLAIQRSNYEVQIWNKETGDTISQKCRSESESILGFFWADCPTCDIVFVKTSGLDFYSYNPELKSLHLVETKKLNVSWYIYTHESRLVLLASGMQCKSFTGYQLSLAGIIRLPRFEITMAKSEANNKPILAAEDVHIITVYGRIYCLQFDRAAMLLHSYRFYRDAVVQQGSLPIYSNRIAVSVVDNILLVHQVDAKVVIIYDMFAESRTPISAPLPLLLRGFSRASESKELSDPELIIYGDDWSFLVPDLICDVANGYLWKIHLDLEAISASSSDTPSVLEFLQRRKLEANKAKQLCLEITRTLILERRSLPVVARAIDVLITTYSQAIKTGSYQKRTNTEDASPSGVSNLKSPNTEVDESSRVDASGIKQESARGIESESSNRSTISASVSDGSVSFETKKMTSHNLDSSSGKTEGGYMVEPEASGAQVDASIVQSQILGPGSNALNANASEQLESQVSSAAISPADLYRFVFAAIEEEMAGDATYLVSIIVEFLRSASLEKLKVDPNIYVLIVQLLAREERYEELVLFVLNKIIDPSKEVAMQLIESGHQNVQTRKLGLDMLRELSLHHDYVLLLVQDRYYLEALRYARKNKVNTVRPSLFLEAAHASNDSQHLAAVLRFFSDFIPGFKNTSEHNSYCRIVADMNSSIAT
ncbi:Colon cancer-associated Mic1-like [Abeliophyllum distichum]|uniref:Colon cancer-associated Mic1-like n=1 Tax=Abeliophyllum distichum TaxID=126358 RepID=A0ABD1VFB1_9LAMI